MLTNNRAPVNAHFDEIDDVHPDGARDDRLDFLISASVDSGSSPDSSVWDGRRIVRDECLACLRSRAIPWYPADVRQRWPRSI